VIECSLETTSLRKGADPPQYEALSYAWGGGSGLKTTCVDGLDIQIRFNLGSTLRRISKMGEPHYLWVDDTLINQYDTVERSQQV
ncbi:hypothetical protein BAUCODRAFT_39897, partial [Baudoinia panamericana UAMH 10762]